MYQLSYGHCSPPSETTIETLSRLFSSGSKRPIEVGSSLRNINVERVLESILVQNLDVHDWELRVLDDYLNHNHYERCWRFQSMVGNAGIGKTFALREYAKMLNARLIDPERFDADAIIDRYIKDLRTKGCLYERSELVKYCTKNYATYITFGEEMPFTVDEHYWKDKGDERLLLTRSCLLSWVMVWSTQIFFR